MCKFSRAGLKSNVSYMVSFYSNNALQRYFETFDCETDFIHLLKFQVAISGLFPSAQQHLLTRSVPQPLHETAAALVAMTSNASMAPSRMQLQLFTLQSFLPSFHLEVSAARQSQLLFLKPVPGPCSGLRRTIASTSHGSEDGN